MRGNPQGSINIISLVMCDMGCSSPKSDIYWLMEKSRNWSQTANGVTRRSKAHNTPSFTRKGNGKTRCWSWKQRLHLHRNPATGQTYSTLDRFLCHLRVDVCNGLCLCQHVYLRIWIGLRISESIPKMEKQPRWQIVRCELMSAAAFQSTVTVKTATVNV